MDADWIESRRDPFLSRREKRWSMNSQRLEEIVAVLMKPIKDDRRNFDMDLCALLEEYLTEAGLHALDAAELLGGDAELVTPNFPEVALLLQQSVTIYGRKVDFLYTHVLHISDSMHNNTQEIANTSTSSEPQTPSTSRRKRRASSHGDFVEIVLESSGAATREPEAPRPPPTLPRMYIELAPRRITAADVPLFDYAAEDIGLLGDFQVTWRLHEGLLVDELEGGATVAERALRPIPLLELQAAIEAAAPASPPPLRYDSPPPARSPRLSPPLRASTPLPAPPAEPPPPPPPPSTVKRERKRCSDVKIDDIFEGIFKIVVGKYLTQQLKAEREFHISEKWISSVVRRRKIQILNERRRLLRETTSEEKEFAGWTGSEAELAQAAAAERLGRREPDSDDDGFFEQSSGGDLEAQSPLRGDEPAPAAPPDESPAARARREAAEAAAAEMAAWRESILRRAAASEARGSLDVHALGAELLAALGERPAAPGERLAALGERPAALGERPAALGERPAARPFRALLRERVRHETDVSRIMLTTLFLANAGNVEIIQGPPLSLNTFSLRLLSSDMRTYSLLSAADERLLR